MKIDTAAADAAGGFGVGTLSADDLGPLYRAHQGWLTAWFRRRLGNRQDAEDFAHDAFVRVVVRRATLDLSQPRALLSAIGKGLLIDHFRRHALEQAYLAELAVADVGVSPSAEDVAATLETLREVDRMLRGLSAKARAAFLFSRVDGLTHADIAEALQVSVSRVRQYLAQALRHVYDAEMAHVVTSHAVMSQTSTSCAATQHAAMPDANVHALPVGKIGSRRLGAAS